MNKNTLAWKIAELEQIKIGGKVFQYSDFHKPNQRVKALMRQSKNNLYKFYMNLIKERLDN